MSSNTHSSAISKEESELPFRNSVQMEWLVKYGSNIFIVFEFDEELTKANSAHNI